METDDESNRAKLVALKLNPNLNLWFKAHSVHGKYWLWLGRPRNINPATLTSWAGEFEVSEEIPQRGFFND